MRRYAPVLRLSSAALLVAVVSVKPSVSPADEFVARVPLPAVAPETVVPDRFVVEFKQGVAHRLEIGPDAQGRPRANVASVQRALDRIAAVRAEREFLGTRPQGAGSRFPDLTGYYLVSIPEGASLSAAMDAMAAEPDVDHVEPIGIHFVDLTPNDTYYAYGTMAFPYDEWHLWDQYGIDADLAWNTETGTPSVLVGILDTGVKYRHTDLGGANPPGPADNSTQGNVWVNPGEIPGNGVDDDANGYVDDVIGYDFINVASSPGGGYTCIDNDCGGMDNDPNDGNGHGTHVSGTVAAITNNARAVAGVVGGFSDGTTGGAGNGCKIVPCRMGVTWQKGLTVVGVVYMDAAAAAMNYMANLVDDGFNVAAVNCSWGNSNSGGLSAAADNLLAHDVMIIASAGNNTSNMPTSFLVTKPGVMAVAAADSNGRAASFTNYGSWVHLAAPGVTVMSTWHEITDPDTTHMYVALLDGTSMSAPHTTGVAALLESYNPALTRADKFSLMENHTGPLSPMEMKDLGSGILNANLALAAAPPPTTGVASDILRRAGTLALSASPNPARAGTDLLVRALPGGHVRVAVVDASGRHVRALEGVASTDGGLRLRWDGRDADGRRVGVGLYMILASAGRERATAKLVVLE